MRSRRLLFGGLAVVTVLVAACSSPPVGGAVGPGYEVPSGSGGAQGTSSGGSSSGGQQGTSSGGEQGTSSGGTSSGGSSSGSGAAGSSSGSSSGAATGGNTITADTTWSDGTTLSAATTIASGVTVTIAPGATIHVASGVAITVQGTLTATTSSTHAQLTGTSWTGLVIASGGTLTADSLDFTGASAPIDVSGTATYSNGTINASAQPILVETGGSLTVNHVNAVATTGKSLVAGNFTASYLDYDRGAGDEGITFAGTSSVVKIDNSTFHGEDDVTGDMIIVNACASLTMTYTTITGCHCAYHFNGIDSFDLENMNLTGDSYGFMMYGSSTSTGTRVFKNSNVETMAAYGIDEIGTNGAISVEGVYFDSSSKLQLSDQEVTVSGAASAPLPATSVGPQ